MSRNRTITICGLLLGTLALAPSLTAQLGHKKDFVYAGPRVLAVESQGCITEDASCNVGIGTDMPEAQLHIKQSGPARLFLENTGKAKFSMRVNNSSQWVVGEAGVLDLLLLDTSGHLTITGDLTVNGLLSCDGCDRVFQPDYPLPTIEEHSAAMFGNSYLPAIGPTPDEEPGPIQVGDKLLRMLNELEVAHIYIDQLNNRLKGTAAVLDEYGAAGRWVDASSRELKQDVAELRPDEAIEAVMALSPIRFAYNEDPSEEHLGFIAEDVPELVARADRKTLSAMDVVAVLTKTVQEQQRLLEAKDTQLQRLEQRMARLEGLLQADAGPSS